jgi:hypothetical protein
MNKPLYTNCPDCDGKMAIPLVAHLSEIVGTTPGCPSCGKLLFCVPPGKLILFDDKKHEASKELPVVCKECRGCGIVRTQQGDYKARLTCHVCAGSGRA